MRPFLILTWNFTALKIKVCGFFWKWKWHIFFEITRVLTIFSDKIQSIQNFRKKWLQLVTWPRMSILIKNALFWSFGGINGSKNGSIFDKVKGLPCRFYRFWPLFKTWPRMKIKSTYLEKRTFWYWNITFWSLQRSEYPIIGPNRPIRGPSETLFDPDLKF